MKKWVSFKYLAALFLALMLLALGACGEKEPSSESESGAESETEKAEMTMYFNVDGLSYLDEATGSSSRKAAEGFYSLKVAGAGSVIEVRTDNKKLVNALDQKRIVMLSPAEDGTVTDYESAEDAGYEVALDLQFVSEVDGTKVKVNMSQNLDGMASTFQINDGTVIYDVSPDGNAKSGAAIQVADQVSVVCDPDGDVAAVYILQRGMEPDTSGSVCPHCQKEVQWVAITNGTQLPAASGHYYLAEDVQLQLETRYANAELDLVIDLHGQTLTAADSKRAILVNSGGKLSILDSVGEGKIVSNVTGSTEENGVNGSVLFIMNGTFNFYGGTLVSEATEEKYSGGVVRVGNGASRISTMNMYGGTIMNGKGALGGNLYVSAYSDFNMYGGTITGGSSQKGNNVYIDVNKDLTPAEVNLYAGTITGGIYLKSAEAEDTLLIAEGVELTDADGGYTVVTGQ